MAAISAAVNAGGGGVQEVGGLDPSRVTSISSDAATGCSGGDDRDGAGVRTPWANAALRVTVEAFLLALVAPNVSWNKMELKLSGVGMSFRSSISGLCWSSPVWVTVGWLMYLEKQFLYLFVNTSSVSLSLLLQVWMSLRIATSRWVFSFEFQWQYCTLSR